MNPNLKKHKENQDLSYQIIQENQDIISNNSKPGIEKKCLKHPEKKVTLCPGEHT